jgi:hypothetical protein
VQKQLRKIGNGYVSFLTSKYLCLATEKILDGFSDARRSSVLEESRQSRLEKLGRRRVG